MSNSHHHIELSRERHDQILLLNRGSSMQMFFDDLYLYFPVGVLPAMRMSRKPIRTTVGIADDRCGYSGQLKALLVMFVGCTKQFKV